MSIIYDLKVPQGHGNCNYVELKDKEEDAIYRIGGLSGCMGVICYLKESGVTNCLMAHDSSDRYAVTKREVTNFFKSHMGSIANILVYWSARNIIGQNEFFLSAKIQPKNIRFQDFRVNGTQIWLPHIVDDYKDPKESQDHILIVPQINSEPQSERPTFTPKGDKSTWSRKDTAGVVCCYCTRPITPRSEVHRCRMCGKCVHAPLGGRKCSDFYIMNSCGVKSFPWPLGRGERFCRLCIDSVVSGAWGEYNPISA
jgi:hypothetical protein